MFNLAVIGETGQLARALAKLTAQQNINAKFLNRKKCDLSQSEAHILSALNGLGPNLNAVIIAAAYTAVDQAETDQENAHKVNGTAPGIIASFCKARDIPLVHISTDYVFNGQAKSPYRPEHPTQPLNIYGASKLAGEEAVKAQSGRHAILRTSWVFDGMGKNFLTTMLRLGETRESLAVVADQYGRPTFAGHLAEAALKAVKLMHEDSSIESGVYHVTGSGNITHWAGFAKAIFEASHELRDHSVDVNHITTSDYPTPAQRPAYSAMDITKFETTFSHLIPDWKSGLKAAMLDYANHRNEEET